MFVSKDCEMPFGVNCDVGLSVKCSAFSLVLWCSTCSASSTITVRSYCVLFLQGIAQCQLVCVLVCEL